MVELIVLCVVLALQTVVLWTLLRRTKPKLVDRKFAEQGVTIDGAFGRPFGTRVFTHDGEEILEIADIAYQHEAGSLPQCELVLNPRRILAPVDAENTVVASIDSLGAKYVQKRLVDDPESIKMHPGMMTEAERLEEIADTRKVLVDLLASADPCWEDGDEPSDWAQACEAARELLKE